MAIAKRLYPILMGETGELDGVEVDNTIRNAWTAVYALQEDVTLMQEKVAGAIRRGEIAENDSDASVNRVANAVRTTVVQSPTLITGAKLVNPLSGRLPVINGALELEGGVNAPEYSLSTKTLTIRGALNISGASTLTGNVTMAGTLAVTGVLTTTAAATIGTDLTVSDQLIVQGAGPHVIGASAPSGDARLWVTGAFVSNGAGTELAGVWIDDNLTGATGDTTRLEGVMAQTIIRTQAASESIANISQMVLEEPQIVDNLTGGGLITNAQTLLILGAPSEGVTNAAIRVTAGQCLFKAVTVAGTLTTLGRIKTVTRKTTTYTILVTDSVIFCNTDSTAFTATLPAGVSGQTFKIINSGSGGKLLTVAPNGSEHLLGVNSNFVLFDAETLDLTYDATDGWY